MITVSLNSRTPLREFGRVGGWRTLSINKTMAAPPLGVEWEFISEG
jgi:hypothetical protein